MLGETLRQREGAALYETVERVRALSKSGRAGSDRDLDARRGAAPRAAGRIHGADRARVFAFPDPREHRRAAPPGAPPPRLSARSRRRRRSAGRARKRSRACWRAASAPDALHAATTSLRIELVLTAHPTAITRRTLIQKHLRIAGALARQDRVDMTAPERAGDRRAAAPRDHGGVGDRRDPAAAADAC